MGRLDEIRDALTKLKLRLSSGELDEVAFDRLKEKILSDLTPEERTALGTGTPTPRPTSGSGAKLGPSGGTGSGLRTAIPSLSDLDLSPGTILLDQWRIGRELGRGGFGAVFEAEELHLGQRQAVKVLDPVMVAREELLERFRREVLLMRQLVHPYIVRVYDYREDLEQHLALISMEHVAGGSVAVLRDLAKKGGEPVPIPLALAILFQTLEALAEAHARGVIHRDVTPGNILLSGGTPRQLLEVPGTDPGVKLVDFGIAGLVERSELSQGGRVLGAAAYVAPEVLDPEVAVSPAVDVYGAGAVVYELVTGELPLGRFETPSELREGLPDGLDDLLIGLLARRPQKRTTSAVAVEMKASLSDFAIQGSIENLDGWVEAESESESPKRDSLEGRQPGYSWVEPVLGMRFRWIPAGTFLMGSPEGEEAGSRDETQHEVLLTRGFWMGETPVTQGQWRRLMGANPSFFHTRGDGNPVEQVSWLDAVGFANALSERAELSPCYQTWEKKVRFEGLDCAGLRLPTEAEWEYAARAGTKDWFGVDLEEIAWHKINSNDMTHEVGKKRANDWGLFDMLGNVWEWVWDGSGDYPCGFVADPTGPLGMGMKVTRGGDFRSSVVLCSPAARLFLPWSLREKNLGFRLARTDLG